jgi:hypothetical protein
MVAHTTVVPVIQEAVGRKIEVQGQPWENSRPYLKNI